MVVVVVAVAGMAVVELAVVIVSFGMILCLQRVQFWCLLKRHNGPTDGRTDGRYKPSYRDARTHLKIG